MREMLYERWQMVSRMYRSEVALRDLGTGQTWTFGALAEEAERGSNQATPGVVYPQGATAGFVLEVLRAWRNGHIVCPLEAGQAPPKNLPPPPPQIVHLKTTSATTGQARLVAMTAPQLIADAENIVQTMGLRPEWPNLAVISLAHSYGFSNLITPLLLHGIPLALVPAPLPEVVRQAAASLPAITLAAVPALWRAWHDAASLPGNIQLAISAGAPLQLSLEQEIFNRHGLKLHNFYGSSECGGIAYDRASEPRSDAAMIGQPMENVRLSVDSDGCLEVRGAAVAETYWPEAEPNLGNGCFRTSDLVEFKEGLIYLRGRMGDQINVAGRKISPEAVERIIAAHPEVRECLVFGVPSQDPARVEEIVACVAAKGAVAAETLKQFLLAQLPAWQVPREWWFVNALEASQRGKLSRHEWRKKYLLRAES
ncbi:MAG TPA: fatty acid--CoA ligase family protein [Verrucomicrobiae bacterium]|jgi:acyl-CoA synthetase (AMP-forming)/AMP-acid ligase II